jgi:hypothetical protein
MLLVSIEGWAWGPTGHRVVGLVAQLHLNAKAKKKLSMILGHQSLPLITTWMDDIRSDSTHIDMADWHWVTVETGSTYEQSPKNPKGDVIATLQRVIKELSSHQLTAAQELDDIRILVHLVGDIHQPLHVGCCDDNGGNKAKVKWFGRETSLHHVWDSDMIDDTKLSYTEFPDALPFADEKTVATWQKANVLDWARESMSYREEVYNVGDKSLGYVYNYYHFSTVKLRLKQAGIRLAGILNEIYGQ